MPRGRNAADDFQNLLTFICDEVIRENPASRGTEASAEFLVGPPLGAGGWSETPVNSSGTRLTLTLDGGLEGPPRPVMAPYPFPSASSVGVGTLPLFFSLLSSSVVFFLWLAARREASRRALSGQGRL